MNNRQSSEKLNDLYRIKSYKLPDIVDRYYMQIYSHISEFKMEINREIKFIIVSADTFMKIFKSIDNSKDAVLPIPFSLFGIEIIISTKMDNKYIDIMYEL